MPFAVPKNRAKRHLNDEQRAKLRERFKKQIQANPTLFKVRGKGDQTLTAKLRTKPTKKELVREIIKGVNKCKNSL